MLLFVISMFSKFVSGKMYNITYTMIYKKIRDFYCDFKIESRKPMLDFFIIQVLKHLNLIPKLHHDGSITCPICGKKLKNIMAFRTHALRTKSHDTLFQHLSDILSKLFVSFRGTYYHTKMTTRNGVKVTVFKCLICKRKFDEYHDVLFHILYVHPEVYISEIKKSLRMI